VKKLVSVLQNSSIGLADLLDQVSDAIIFTDPHAVIQGWNKSAEKIYQWKRAEVLGVSSHKILPLTNNLKDHNKLLSVLEKKGVWQGEAPQKRRDGSNITILSSISLVKDKTGKKVGYIIINRDISERKKSEDISRFKEEVSRILSSSLDYKKTLNNVVKIVVPGLADWCAVDLRFLFI
jgi:PAS domain S-box-containing protein